nr:MAG TPA: hypothetical protein [Caudoviricetes sp.]
MKKSCFASINCEKHLTKRFMGNRHRHCPLRRSDL